MKGKIKSQRKLYVIGAIDINDNIWFMTEYGLCLGWSTDHACVMTRPDHCGYSGARKRNMIYPTYGCQGIKIKKVFISRLNSKTCPISINIKDKTNKLSKYNWKIVWIA